MIYSTTGAVGFTGTEIYVEEFYLLLGIIIVGIMSAVIPAFGVYKVDISKVLAED